MKVSVIVPVYNVEAYLGICLNSLLPALNDTDEVLLVQGDSSDKSRDISVQYQGRYPQIKIMEQDGKGLSNARNCGLKAAAGDTVLFIDSDDFVDTNALTNLLAQVRENTQLVDVWLADYYRFFESDGRDRLVCQIGTRTACNLSELTGILSKRQCFWNVWKNVYRREFLIKNGLLFVENTYAEDIDFITRLFLTEPRIQTVDVPFYHYRMDRNGSLMNEVPLARIQDTVAVLENSIEKLRTAGVSWASPIISGFQFEYLLNLALIQEAMPEQRQAAAKAFAAYPETLMLGKDPVIRGTAFCLHLIGVRNMSRLMWIAKQIKRKREHRTL